MVSVGFCKEVKKKAPFIFPYPQLGPRIGTESVTNSMQRKPSFPPTFVGDLRELPRVPMRGEGRCRVGGASRDSTGFVAMVTKSVYGGSGRF